MAANIWDNSDADGDGNNANNWSLGTVPAGTDVATFDNTSDTNCTFTGNITCSGMNITSDYDGDIDFGANDMTFGADGLVWDGAGALDLGTGTVEFTETCVCDLIDGGGARTFNGGTVLISGGVCTMSAVDTNTFLTLSVSAGAELITAFRMYLDGVLTLDGTLTLTTDDFYILATGDAKVTATGTIAGGRTFYIFKTDGARGLSQCDNTLTVGRVQIWADAGATPKLVPFTTTGQLKLTGSNACSTTMDAGTYTCGSFAINAFGGSTLTVDMTAGVSVVTGTIDFDNDSANVATIDMTGAASSFTASSSITVSDGGAGGWAWTSGTADPEIVLNGTVQATVAFPAATGPIEVAKTGSGKVVLGSDWDTTNGVTITSGTLEQQAGATFATGTPLTDCTIAAAGTLLITAGDAYFEGDLINSGTISVASGATLRTNAAPTIDVQNKAGASVTGAGTFRLVNITGASNGVTEQAGTWDITLTLIYPGVAADCLVAGTYQTNLFVGNVTGTSNAILFSGTYLFDSCEFQCDSTGDLTADVSTSAANVSILGDLTLDLNNAGDIIILGTDKLSTFRSRTLTNEDSGAGSIVWTDISWTRMGSSSVNLLGVF